MKFHWFHLMPYRWLPKEFPDDPRGGWVENDSSLWNAERGHHLYHEYLDELEHAARCGFDGICLNEHHSSVYGQVPSPNLMAAALARRTHPGVGLIVIGNSLPLYDPPIRVAEELAMLDVLSGGRLVAGMALGTPMDACYAYGLTPATLRERFREAHDLIVRAWTEPEPFSFNGRFTQLRYVNIWPRPMQQPRPPIWIPGGGSVETWDWCIQQNHLYAMLSYWGFKKALSSFDRYWERLVALDAEPNPYRAGFLQMVCVGESDRDVEKEYGKHVEFFFNRSLHVAGGLGHAPGYLSETTMRSGTAARIERPQAPNGGPWKWKDLIEEGMVIAGSPLTVSEKLEHLIKRVHVGHLMVMLQIGSMPKELTQRNSELFAQQVMPKLSELWDDRWKDEWWIKPTRTPATPGDAESK